MIYGHTWEETQPALRLDSQKRLQYAALPENICTLLYDSVSRWPAKTAVSDERRSLSYLALWDAIEQAAALLQKQTVGPGERVALMLFNSADFVAWFFATARIGAISVPLNTRLLPAELVPLLKQATPRVVITDPESSVKIKEALAQLPQPPALLNSGEAFQAAEAFTKSIPATTLVERTAPLTMIFTSGTTGGPKGALLSHENILTSAESYRYVFKLDENDTTLVSVPLFHVTGLIGQLLPILRVGGHVVLMPRFSDDGFLQLMSKYSVTMFFGVPTIFVRVLHHPRLNDHDLSRWRIAASGGAPIARITIEQMKEHFPNIAMFNTYGMTEVSSPATILPAAEAIAKNGSVGLPVPTAQLRIVDPDTMQDVSPRQPGELWIYGPMVMGGYWNNPEANARALRDGWMRSGDIVQADEDGYIYIMDRMKDIINRGGEKIFCGEVENVLYRHPAVMEASVVGIPDEVWGECVAAAIVLKDSQVIDVSELTQWLRGYLAGYKVPSHMKVVPELPRNANGKVEKLQVKQFWSAS